MLTRRLQELLAGVSAGVIPLSALQVGPGGIEADADALEAWAEVLANGKAVGLPVDARDPIDKGERA